MDAVKELVARARTAQRIAEGYDQARIDELVSAAGWAIIEPSRNRLLAALAVADTGIGNVANKVLKNHRKTLGLLRDLQGAKSVGVISEDPTRGLIEIARPVGVVCAVTPSTNPAATPANKIINALKGRNAVIVAPSPKGWTTAAMLVGFVQGELRRIGAPVDLVQLLPDPITKAATAELMRQCDLVVATGSQANVRAAAASGTPSRRRCRPHCRRRRQKPVYRRWRQRAHWLASRWPPPGRTGASALAWTLCSPGAAAAAPGLAVHR